MVHSPWHAHTVAPSVTLIKYTQPVLLFLCFAALCVALLLVRDSWSLVVSQVWHSPISPASFVCMYYDY
jgi:hypothetical protein